ncbi:hypothetical protein DH2020_026417 [Rehmannia glutinosa]|uniref:Glutaredoxin domain-containing protein n=1 Tax=Rehmannia glutinosa TaxID=99300 RepID=A0ABR0W0W5_REHGL
MGCVSSKLVAKEIEQEKKHKNGNYTHHVVSLTSSTYGVLSLDKEKENQPQKQEIEEAKQSIAEVNKTSPSREDPPEIINTWELMEGLEEEMPVVAQSKKAQRRDLFCVGLRIWILEARNSPNTVLKECNNLKENVKKPSPRLWASIKGSPNVKRCDSLRIDSGVVFSKRKSLGPLFDPQLVASFEKEVSEEEEEIKKMVSVSSARISQKARDSDAILDSYKKKCPPGGENAVVIYTTTLRGIRKTFEDCNVARLIIESHNVLMFERDISMDSGFKEEIRGLMGSKEVRVPLVFVKGRLIGGADEMVKLDEEGKLGILLDGILRAAAAGCPGCAGIRFMMCVECNGSCKLLGDDGRKSVKCCKCNENGLIVCPICC